MVVTQKDVLGCETVLREMLHLVSEDCNSVYDLVDLDQKETYLTQISSHLEKL